MDETRAFLDDFDLDAPYFNDSYDDVVAALASSRTARSHVGHGYTVVGAYQDVRECAQNWQTFSSAQGVMPNRPLEKPLLYPEELDPPLHNVWRQAINSHFGPAAIDRLTSEIESHARRLLDQMGDGRCDVLGAYVGILPGLVFMGSVLGVDAAGLDELQPLLFRAQFGPIDQRGHEWRRVFGFAESYLRSRADTGGHPRGDVIDAILGVRLDGQPAPFADMVSVLVDLIAGGLGTTTYVMSGALIHLAQHPEHRQVLNGDPNLLSGAVEEFLRYYAPAVALARTTTREVELAGKKFAPGDCVVISYSSACRDPQVVNDPQRCDPLRMSRHVAFGLGPHRCVGSHLARREILVAVRLFLERFPDFQLSATEPPLFATSQLRTVERLVLELGTPA